MNRGGNAGAAGPSAGFMLVEVVVALAIAAMAFGMAFHALSGGFDRLRKDHNSAKALLLAESMLDRIGHDIALGAADQSGSTRDGFAWVVQTAPYPAATAETNPLVGYVVRVSVHWQEQRNRREIQLTTLRLARRSGGT
ncbi:MAG: type II secretion system protein J [Thiohalocapsa sp.]